MDLQPVDAGLLIGSIGKIASFRIAGALLCVLCVPFAIFAVKSFLPQRTQRKTQRAQRKCGTPTSPSKKLNINNSRP
jgi:hypothetical protein